MKKKYILYGLCGTAALAGAALLILYLRLGSIIKTAVETFGPKVTQTEIKVGTVLLSPFSGNGKITKVLIGNPKGYKTKSAFELGQIEVEVDIKSLRSNRILIKKIIVDEPVVTFEGGLTGNNLKQIQKNIESFSGAPGASKTQSKNETKLEIGHFLVRKGKVNVILAGAKSIPVALPQIELRDIGRKSGGATPAEAAKAMLGAITKTALNAGIGALGLLKDGTNGAAKGVKSVLGLFKKKKK